MRRALAFLLALGWLAAAGCGGGERGSHTESSASQGAASAPSAGGSGATMQQVSLKQADAAQNVPVPSERKIIRNAELTIETDSVTDAQRKVTSVAESHGGLVVNSESQQQTDAGGEASQVITMEVRVPAAQFDATLDEIRGAGRRVTTESIKGQDVTEEYIDLDARLRAQQALEAQFLEIMKQARTVEETLGVQRELANVRTEIEKIEGRRRFLENQTSLSTIKVTLRPAGFGVSGYGFFSGLREAFSDGLHAAAVVTLFIIRFIFVLIPVILLLVLPVVLLVRFLSRRGRGRARPAPAHPDELRLE